MPSFLGELRVKGCNSGIKKQQKKEAKYAKAAYNLQVKEEQQREELRIAAERNNRLSRSNNQMQLKGTLAQ